MSILIVDDQFLRTTSAGSGANSTALGVPAPTGSGAWIDHLGGQWTSASGRLTGVVTSSQDYGVNYIYRPVSDACADQQVIIDTDYLASGAVVNFGAYLRMIGASGSSVNGYFGGVYSGQVQFFKITGGTGNGSIGSSTAFTSATGHKYRFIFSVVGTTLSYSIYDLGTTSSSTNTQIGSTYSTTDTTYAGSASTVCGFSTFNGTNAVITRYQFYNASTPTVSMSVAPNTAYPGLSQTITATGTGTSWTAATTFTVTGGTGASISGISVNVSAQTATFTLAAGSSTGTLTIANSTDTGTATVTVVAGQAILPNSASLLYSPYNWLVGASAAKTINSGAYFRTLLSGTATCKINLTLGTATPYSQAWARIDGGAWQQYIPTSSGSQTWTLSLPSNTTSTVHLLEFVVKSTTLTQDRWNSQTTALQFNGLVIDTNGSASAPGTRKYRVLIYGDSITEGFRVNGSANSSDTNDEDALGSYALAVGTLIDAEIGIVAFSGTGISATGNGNVPPLPTTYNLLWSGQSRTFSPVPDLVIYNEGTNDSGNSINAAYTGVINGVGTTGTTFSGFSGTRHLLLRPLNGNQSSNVQQVAAGFSSPAVLYGNTTGFWSTSDSTDNLHPYAYSNLNAIAPGVAALALPLLSATLGNTGGTATAAFSVFSSGIINGAKTSMAFIPGGTYFGVFTTQNPATGSVTSASALPVMTATHNGADDSTFALTVSLLDTGRYKVTGTIPSGYAYGDVVQIVAAATVNGVAGKALVDSFVLTQATPAKYTP